MKTIKLNEQLKALQNTLKDRWGLFQQIHNAILAVHPKIMYRVFPLYVVYGLEEENVALIYYKGPIVRAGGLFIGLNLPEAPQDRRFVIAKNIKYPGISYEAKLQNMSQVTPKILNAIRLIGAK